MDDLGFSFPGKRIEVVVKEFKIAGTYTLRVPINIQEIIFSGVGGGGGGGGDAVIDGTNFGGGGGSSAFAFNYIMSVVPGSLITVVVGAAGPEASAGTSTVVTYVHPFFGTVTITLGPGGGGGVGNNNPGTAGTASVQSSLSAVTWQTGLNNGSAGGISTGASSPFGTGGVGGSDANGSPPSSTSYGCGGGGAQISMAPARNGAAGMNGYARFSWVE